MLSTGFLSEEALDEGDIFFRALTLTLTLTLSASAEAFNCIYLLYTVTE